VHGGVRDLESSDVPIEVTATRKCSWLLYIIPMSIMKNLNGANLIHKLKHKS